MGIDFNWEVEEDGPGAASEPSAPSVPGLPPGLRRLLMIVGVAVAAGIAIYTAYQQRAAAVEDARQEELEATIAAETAALRIGDRRAFLTLQQRDDDWLRAQSRAFRAYQENADRIDLSGGILSTEIDGEYGRALVEQTVDGQTGSIEWCYVYTERRWRHSPTCGPFWGEVDRISSDDIEIAYYPPDEALARDTLATLDGWWAAACTLTGCDAPPHFALAVTRNPADEGDWQVDGGDWAASIPGGDRGFSTPSDAAAPLEVVGVQAAASWADLALEGVEGDPEEVAWLHDQLEAQLREQFGLGDPGFLSWLTALYGPAVVPQTLAAVRAGEPVVPALQRAIAGRMPASLPDGSLEAYLESHLRAEAALHAGRDPAYDTALLFRDPDADFESALPWAVGFLQMVDPDSIEVTSLRGFGEVTWAEIHATLTVGQLDGQRARLYVPFRVMDGRWLHTRPRPEDWGSARLRTSNQFRMYYRTLDGPQVSDLLGDLEPALQQITADYGIEPPTPITIVVQGLEGGKGPQRPGSPDSEEIQFSLASPYLDMTLLDENDQPLGLDRQMKALLIIAFLQQESGYTANAACFQQALRQWEFERVGVSTPTSQGAALGSNQQGLLPSHVEELWTSWSCADTDYAGEARQYAARSLLDTLVALHGAAVVPALIDNLAGATSARDWLTRSIEPAPNIEALEVRWTLHMEAGLSDDR